MMLGIVASVTVNGLTIIIDGETSATEKSYRYLSSYTPTVGDRILIVQVGDSYVVLGKITA